MINFELNSMKEVVFDGKVYAGISEDAAKSMYIVSVTAANGNEDALKKSFANILKAIAGTIKSVIKDAQAECLASVETALTNDLSARSFLGEVNSAVAAFVREIRDMREKFSAVAVMPLDKSDGNFAITLSNSGALDDIVAEFGDVESVARKDGKWRVVVKDVEKFKLAKDIFSAKLSYDGRVNELASLYGWATPHVVWSEEFVPSLKATPGMTGRTSHSANVTVSIGTWSKTGDFASIIGEVVAEYARANGKEMSESYKTSASRLERCTGVTVVDA